MIAGVGVKVVQIEQKPAPGTFRKLVQKLRLTHVLLWEVNKVHAVFEQERDRYFLLYQPDSGGYELQHFFVIRDRNGETGTVILTADPTHLSEGKMVAMPWEFVAAVKTRDLV